MRQKAELLLAWLSLEYLEHLVPYEAYRPGGRWGQRSSCQRMGGALGGQAIRTRAPA